MPVSIKTGVLKYKNPITGEFISLNQVGDDLYSIIAPKYEDIAFPVSRGTLCIYDGGLYRATVDIPTSEEWDDTHWASTSVDDEMSDYAMRIIDDSSSAVNKTWSANKISSAIENINSFDVQIVQELPTENIKTHTIYFVPKTGSTNDVYEEYIRINNAWELIGTTEIDLSSKADKADTVLDTTLSRGRKANTTVGQMSFAFGNEVEASGIASFAEGYGAAATGPVSHAESSGIASGDASHAEGMYSTASGNGSHAEGYSTLASGNESHSEGAGTKATATNSHSEGSYTEANGQSSHAQGVYTIANGGSSHVFGRFNVADSFDFIPEWVAGTTYAVGDKVKQTYEDPQTHEPVIFAYQCKTANSDEQWDSSHWTSIEDRMQYVEIVGNGQYNARANARTLDWDGNERLAGDVYVRCNEDSTGGNKVATESELHITPVFSPGSNLGEYVCNLTFQEVYDAASNGKCDGCIFQVAPGMGMGLELMAALPSAVSFVKTVSMEGTVTTISLGYGSNGSVTREQTQLDILGLFAKTYAFNTGLFPVKAGDYCINENKFYKANTDIAAFEVFNSSKWDEVAVGSELKAIASNSNAMIANIEEDNTSDYAYAVGDIFVYDNKLYKATSAIAANDYILPNTNCVQTTISSTLDGKEDKPDLIATYTITGTDTATCDKTIEEIGQAYDSGKNIEAVIIVEGQRFKAQSMILNPRPNMYMCLVGTTIYLEGAVYIVLSHSSGSETIPVMQIEPMLSANGVYIAKNMKITRLANPTASTDAANKGYVDTALATKEDKPGLTVTFTAVSNGPIIPPGEPVYSIVCDTTDSDIINANDNNVKIKAVVSIDGIQSELPIHIIENIPSMGQLMVFMGSGFDPMMSSGGPLSSSLSTLTIAKLPGAQDWQMNANGISDVQINGTSIVNDIGVANIPIAGTSSFGAVKADLSYGVGVTVAGNMYVYKAGDGTIKTGTNNYQAIVPSTQHTSAFYGLAKAAGDSTQSASSNPVGTYTDGAKSAIQSMLDVPSTEEASNVVIVSDTEPTEEENKLWINNDDVAEYSVPTVAEMNTALSGKVGDVQVNGTSVVSNGVANVPAASSSALGAVKVNADYGIGLTNNTTYIYRATDDVIKSATNNYRPIVPSVQDKAAFYGLAKASGDTTQASSSNPVGTYTDQAKASIRSMIGAENGDDLIKVQDTQPTEPATKIWLPETAPSSVQVPTVTEMNTALSGKVDDVQVNGTSVVSNGVANVPMAGSDPGVVKISQNLGVNISNGYLCTSIPDNSMIKAGVNTYKPIVPSKQHESVFYGLAKAAGDSTQSASSNAVGTYTPQAKSAIQSMLGVEPGVTFVETVDGATPSITGEPNVRYVCGTVTELSITPPSSGTIEVIFVSGTTPTVLTIPNTVKFPEWVDLSALETSTKYDIIITDGTMGAVMTWAE